MKKKPYKLAKLYYDFLKNNINNKNNKILLNKNYLNEIYSSILSYIENLEDKTELKESYNLSIVNKFLTLIYTDQYISNVFKNDFFNKIYNDKKIVEFLKEIKYEESFLSFFNYQDKLTPLNLNNFQKNFIQNTLIFSESLDLDLKEQDKILFSILTSLSEIDGESEDLEKYREHFVDKVTNKKNIDYLFSKKKETISLIEKILNKEFSSIKDNTIKPQLVFLLNLFKPQSKSLLNKYLNRKKVTFYLDYYLLYDKNENNHTEQITNYLKRIIKEKTDGLTRTITAKNDFIINKNNYFFEYLKNKLIQKYPLENLSFDFDLFLRKKLLLLKNLIDINKTIEGEYKNLINSFNLLDEDKDILQNFNKDFFELVDFLCFEKHNNLNLENFKDFYFSYQEDIQKINNTFEWGISTVEDKNFYCNKGIRDYKGFLELILENVDLCEYLYNHDKKTFADIENSYSYFYEDMKKREACLEKENSTYFIYEQFYIALDTDFKKLSKKDEDFTTSYLDILKKISNSKLRGVTFLSYLIENKTPFLNLKNETKIPNIENFFTTKEEPLITKDIKTKINMNFKF